jgi:hypothetical protein
MSLEEASLLSQIISAVAVVASLIFVGFQLSQNTKAVRASSSQAHAAMYHALIASIINDEIQFARIWRQALADLNSLDDDGVVRFFAFASALFRFFESSRVQWLRGQLDYEHWHTIEQQAISLAAQPGIRDFWNIRRHWHCPEFGQWFDALDPKQARPIYNRPLEGDETTAANSRR